MMRLEKLFVISAAMGIALATGACAENSLELWQHPHAAEGPGFGDNYRQIMAKHIVNPEPVKPTVREAAVEAERTGLGISDYLKGEVRAAPTRAGGSSADVSTTIQR